MKYKKIGGGIKVFYGEFKVSKIRRLIRRTFFFPADFRRTNFRRQIRRLAAAEGSIHRGGTVHTECTTVCWFVVYSRCSITLCCYFRSVPFTSYSGVCACFTAVLVLMPLSLLDATWTSLIKTSLASSYNTQILKVPSTT